MGAGIHNCIVVKLSIEHCVLILGLFEHGDVLDYCTTVVVFDVANENAPVCSSVHDLCSLSEQFFNAAATRSCVSR
jgi:hypothetical protein